MCESGLRTTSYANRVAQGRLFLCLKLPISVQYIGLSERPFSVLRFVPVASSMPWPFLLVRLEMTLYHSH